MSLTPQQKAALDQFETDAQAAADAAAADTAGQLALVQAQQNAAPLQAADVAAHQSALASAQAFIDLMVPPLPTPPAPIGATK